METARVGMDQIRRPGRHVVDADGRGVAAAQAEQLRIIRAGEARGVVEQATIAGGWPSTG